MSPYTAALLALVALGGLAGSHRTLAAEAPAADTSGGKRQQDADAKKQKEGEENAEEAGPAAADGPRAVAKATARIVDEKELKAKQKRKAEDRWRAAPEAKVISSLAKEATAVSLGQRTEISEGDGYRITRKEILPPLGGELHESRLGYTALAASTVFAFDRKGHLLARRSLAYTARETYKIAPKRDVTLDASAREFSLWSANAQGWLGIKDTPSAGQWLVDAKGKPIGHSSPDTKFLLWAPSGGVIFSTVMSFNDHVDIAPDGRSLLQWRWSAEWRGSAGPTVIDTSGARPPKRLSFKILDDPASAKTRYAADDGSIFCTLADRAPEGRTLLHLSRAGEVIYKRTAPCWLCAVAPNGNALLRAEAKPYRRIVLNPQGKQILDVPAGEYGAGCFLNRGDYVALDWLPARREGYGVLFRLSDGQELCSVPFAHFREACFVHGDKLYCYNPEESALTVYSTATSRKLQQVLLRHKEPHSLKVTSFEISEGALQLTLRGRPNGGGPLVYYALEVKEPQAPKEPGD